MNKAVLLRTGHSACPHDCPSTCALDVEVLDTGHIGRVRGAKENTYTAGVICAKVARYAERIHHPDRLLKPVIRGGAKGEGVWKEASWEAALDLIAERFLKAEAEYGSESVWPYYYAGTMGLVQRDFDPPPAACEEIHQPVRQHLHEPRLVRVFCRHGQARRRGSA